MGGVNQRWAKASGQSLMTPLLAERLSRLRLTGQTARDVLAAVHDADCWVRLLSAAESEQDLRVWLDALKFLTMMRDGRPAQTIAVTTTSVNISPDDIKRAREIVRELVTTSERTLAGTVTVIDATATATANTDVKGSPDVSHSAYTNNQVANGEEKAKEAGIMLSGSEGVI